MLLRQRLAFSACFVLALALAGCSSSAPGAGPSGSGGSGASTPASVQFSGVVRGGAQPITGSSVQIFGVGTTGDGSSATPLQAQSVTTDANGSFTITGLTCTGVIEVYITATGGNPGTGTNPAATLMAALGPCSAITSATTVTVDELTTVAAAYALAPYMGTSGSIGSSSQDASALAAAFTLASEFVNPATGASPGSNVPSGDTVPTAQMNTLADIVAACVNTTGGTAGDGTACGNLFSLTTPSSNPAPPTNTLIALKNLASNPTLNTTVLFALTPTNGPFQPILTAAPPDFQVRLAPPASSLVLQITPASISFPSTAVSFTSAPQTVKVQNSGSSAVTLNSVALTGAHTQDFSLVNSCGSSLAPAASCTVQVSATPTANGARNAYLAVNSTSPDSPQYVALSVNGTAPSAGPVTLSTTGLSFTLAGVLQDVTLSNYGNTPLTIRSITETDTTQSGATNGFAVTNSTCGTSLPAQSLCTISVVSTFAEGDSSGTPETASGTITILDDASTGPQTISLSSRNLGNIETTSPSYSNRGIVTFPAQQLGNSETVQARYTGYNAYDEAGWPSISASLSGADPSDFSERITQSGTTINNCSPELNAGPACDITFTFTPSAAGSRTAKAAFPSGYILLTGTGVGPGPSFRVNQSSLTMISALPSSPDPNSIGSSNLTITNNGTTTVSIGASFTGANPSYMSANTGGCGSVAPQATCGVTISFSAPAVGNYSANLILKDTNSSFTYTPIPITASTSYWNVAVFPSTLTFSGIQAVDTTSAAQNFVLADLNDYPIGHPLSVALQPSSNFVLTQGSTCPASSTQTCTLAVAFAPQAAGNISETATITDQTTGLQAHLYLNGTAGSAAYILSTSSVTFPARTTGTTSVPTTVTLTSTGTQTLTVSSITITGVVNNNFTQTNNCSSLPVNATCSINITFAPTVTGPQSATLQITSNALAGTNTIAITGTGQ
jgi:hypothetical protein